MSAALRTILVFAICFIPAALVLIVVASERRLRRSQSKVPFEELRRRPAGETIRLKLIEFNDSISEHFMWLVVPPSLIAMSALFVPTSSWVALVPIMVLSLIFTSVMGYRLLGIIRKCYDYRLGFDGERFVGEELNRLVAKRFEVYHDVPFDGFNVDHVLVGPSGVFAVETKTRRKPFGQTGQKEYRVEFDGSRLRWPTGAETSSLDQAARNAQTVAQWLTSAVGERVAVNAILTLPGWMVERTSAPQHVRVVNPKEISKLLGDEPQILSEILIRRICHQLDQRCKVEIE